MVRRLGIYFTDQDIELTEKVGRKYNIRGFSGILRFAIKFTNDRLTDQNKEEFK